MPANLNALIRYKTINSCLYGGKKRWSIQELIERCSDALAEYRGRYEPISERTIRDDLRVMRSDILGYNAPIKQQKGLYYYSDPGYSIMTISLSDSGLIERIIRFLSEIKPEVSHPELEIILIKLTKLKERHYDEEKQREDVQFSLESPEMAKYMKDEKTIKEAGKAVKSKRSWRITFRTKKAIKQMAPAPSVPEYPDFSTWRDIFSIIKL